MTGKWTVDKLIEKNPELKPIRSGFIEAIELLCDAFERERTLFIAGNGGSMSDALHISGELLKAFEIERGGFIKTELPLQPGVPVWVLGNNPSLASAVENDLPEQGLLFSQELLAAGRPDDVLLGISTSGRSANLIRAFELARQAGIRTISLTGEPGDPLSDLSDIALTTPGESTASVQEYHIKVYHALCGVLEERLFGEGGSLTGPYGSRYERFDFSEITTYPLEGRDNRTDLDRLVKPEAVEPRPSRNADIVRLAEETLKASKAGRPVIVMMGAHLIKNGLSPLLIDLMERGIVSLLAGNAACTIHDMELAYCGGTSESVPDVLPKGEFGFAEETGRIVNGAFLEAFKRKMGAGEALGAILAGDITHRLKNGGDPPVFPYREHSLFYNAYRLRIPFTVHATIGSDIVDQHPSSSAEAKGYASGVDFSIFAAMATHLQEGGVILNVGGAVTQPEVLLKAVSMAANIGKAPQGILTAVFDLFDTDLEDIQNEAQPGYYRRDIKSIVVRIPAAFGGKGLYIQGNQKETFTAFYSHLRYLLEKD